MQLNSIFTKLPTVVNISNKMEGSSAYQQAHAFKGTGTDTDVVVTKPVWLVGKLSLININPDSWNTLNMDPAKKALIITWLQDSLSSSDISVKKEEIICVHQMILQYKNNKGILQIEYTEFVSARSLLNKATTVSSQLSNLK